jgi:hypothetical protein
MNTLTVILFIVLWSITPLLQAQQSRTVQQPQQKPNKKPVQPLEQDTIVNGEQVYKQEFDKIRLVFQNLGKGDKQTIQTFKLSSTSEQKIDSIQDAFILADKPTRWGLTTDVLAKILQEKNINLLEIMLSHNYALDAVIENDMIVIGHLDSIYQDTSFEDYRSTSLAITVHEVLKGKLAGNHIIGRDHMIQVQYNSEGKKYFYQNLSHPMEMPQEDKEYLIFFSKSLYKLVTARRTSPELELKRVNGYEFRGFHKLQPLGTDSISIAILKENQEIDPRRTREFLENQRQLYIRDIRYLSRELKEYFPIFDRQRALYDKP